MRRHLRVVLLLASMLAASADAQSVRGVVVDDSTKLPIPEVLITLIGSGGDEIGPGVRSDSLGSFTVHAARPGTYRVRGVRIGYRPLTSEPLSLGIAQLAVVRLRMTTVAQELIPVRVVERRTLTAAELMSTVGFDLRESKGLAKFLNRERLTAFGMLGLREILSSQLQPTLYVHTDSSTDGVLRIRQGRTSCIPEIFLDGRLLATAPETAVEFDFASPALVTPGDSLRLRLRQDAENHRTGAAEEYALSVLSELRANQIHGIEVYRASQLPAASLAGWFGLTKTAVRPCGTVAVWTKAGRGRRAVDPRIGAAGVQVIAGSVVNQDTGSPIAGVPITLLTDSRDPIGDPVVSDDRGEFTIRTERAGRLRLMTENIGYQGTTTPVFPVADDEVVIVKLFVSPTRSVLTPLGVAARILPQTYGIMSIGGFAYRRERALAGRFFRSEDIRRSGARSLGQLLQGLDGVTVEGPPPLDTITFTRDEDLPACRPTFYIDGSPVVADIESTIGRLALAEVLGVEVYTKEADVPPIFADAGADCGLIAIWKTKPTSSSEARPR